MSNTLKWIRYYMYFLRRSLATRQSFILYKWGRKVEKPKSVSSSYVYLYDHYHDDYSAKQQQDKLYSIGIFINYTVLN